VGYLRGAEGWASERIWRKTPRRGRIQTEQEEKESQLWQGIGEAETRGSEVRGKMEEGNAGRGIRKATVSELRLWDDKGEGSGQKRAGSRDVATESGERCLGARYPVAMAVGARARFVPVPERPRKRGAGRGAPLCAARMAEGRRKGAKRGEGHAPREACAAASREPAC
jgi:hypothetical protein